MLKFNLNWILYILSLIVCGELLAFNVGEIESVTVQGQALASNAGGQEAYSLRLSNDNYEAGLFTNHYLLVDDKPLIGGILALRYPFCGHECWLDAFVQVGGGGSTGGGIIELLWGLNVLKILRVDVVTHVMISSERPILWSYPLWVGVTVPL